MSTVTVSDLRIELPGGGEDIVDEVSFTIEEGEIVGLVGESGSGKTTIGNALLGYARRGARITGGTVSVGEVEVLALDPRALRGIRGRLVGYIPQDPSAALNPVLRIARQLDEVMTRHRPDLSAGQRREAVQAGLAEVGLPQTEEFLRRYPHQLSGGQQQRVVIAMAFLLAPKVIVLDEPTTGLDVTTQHRVIEVVRGLCRRHGTSALYVTHDLSVVATLADRILVAYAGRIVESGFTEGVFAEPAHPYTRRLLAALPDIASRRGLEPIPGRAPSPGARPLGCSYRDRCEFAQAACAQLEPPAAPVGAGRLVRCLRAAELPVAAARTPSVAPQPAIDEPILSVRGLTAQYGSHRVLHGVGLDLGARECLAVVGESGSGKTTLARSIVGLHGDWEGVVAYADQPVAREARQRPAALRREIQYVFQSPYNSLNPRRTIGETIGLPVRHFFRLRGQAVRDRVAAALERVSLPAAYADRFPDQLSGGERQRASIARALVCEPKILICDEVTSALDVSVQAAIVKLLFALQREEGLSLLFVTHDLALVRSIARRVIVMHGGRIVESGETETVLDRPGHAYTQQLLTDTPRVGGLETAIAG